MPDEPEITAPHAAQLLGLNVPYVLQLLRGGALPGRRDKRRGWLTTEAAVRRYQACTEFRRSANRVRAVACTSDDRDSS